MKIHVRWPEISEGKAGSTTECMVALALKRELGAGYASVGHRDATVLVNGRAVRIYLPKNVGDKIRFWDRFHVMLPFSFELVASGFLTGESPMMLARPASQAEAVRPGALAQTCA